MRRKRTCELPFCHGVVEGTRNKRRCDKDRNIHLHQVISKNVRKIMRFIESHEDFTANDVNRELFKNKLDKNEKGSMYRLFQAMVREGYLVEKGKRDGLKVYAYGLSQKATTVPEAKLVETPTTQATSPQQENSPQIAPPQQSQVVVSPREILIAKLKEFVIMKNGAWNHDDWLWLINREDIREFGLHPDEIGLLLEDQKREYWQNR